MKYEIDIEGLPEEWEIISAKCESLSLDASIGYFRAQIRRKVRKYDHSKTLDDVLVMRKGASGCYPHSNILKDSIRCISPVWQPNIHGKCPVDGEACHVKLKFSDGHEWHGKASEYEWSHPKDGTFPALIAWQFIRLADGVEW